ncbi:MAG: hydroxymethylglutaryl-CoA reductase, degradative [Legionellaceae bacterium]|nr:hydroxymethylglutaryl-CoA reductase, degradative [Legionellaceae bacterium]
MSLTKNTGQLFQGFSKLSREERFQRLYAMGALTKEDTSYLQSGGLDSTNLADKLIENVIGYFQLPLGVATNFCIDGRDYVIPMAVEETSIIAALSKTAKWVRQSGELTTHVDGDCILGQIQLANVSDFDRFATIFTKNKQFLIEKANEDVAASMVKRGGGVMDLELRRLQRPDGGNMVIIHLLMNSCDAMGANIINQVLEYLKTPIEQLTDEQVSICILSNLNDRKLTTAKVVIRDVTEQLGERIQEASFFAETDPYRAATHNKGVMNGIDPVLIATGNDWRAVEAGVHAYATRSGQYQAITRWRYADNILTGELTAPIIVGTIGGVTALHPTAQLCLRMMHVQSANELSRVVAAVGLLQNLGAIKALCTEGIIQGHMKLHIDNLLMVAGATDTEVPVLKKKLQLYLARHKRVSLNHACKLLAEIRESQFAL